MRIDVRAVKRLRESVDAPAVFGPIVETLGASSADLSRLRVVCDWIQYRKNFREVVDYRPVLGAWPGRQEDSGLEIAVDLRRCPDVDLAARTKEVLEEAGRHAGADAVADTAAEPGVEQSADGDRITLEDWVPGRDSCIWRFNALYWQALSQWEKATGREYEQALPGGESDARNQEAVRELILELFKVWDDLDARQALPEELYIVELGVGNGNQARTWLDAFAELDVARGRDYYHRLHYLMGDYSPHVLERARKAVAHHGDRVNALVLDAVHPAHTLGFLAGKAFLVYISNLYDNLPSDEVACIDGRMYQVEVRAYLRAAAARQIAETYGVALDQLGTVIDRLLRLGPELLSVSLPDRFPDPERAVGFWRDVWEALRLQERYVPMAGLDLYQISPSLSGEILRPVLEAAGDLRMHVNNGTLSSFADTLPLLHPYGRLQCHDLFLTDRRQYRNGFYGPGKYDGSVVNWVNGPLLQLIGNRRGFDVRFSPFKQRPSANVKTLTAQARD
ncbi:MAG TPA: class I SAM-dependent methyltransferase [Streptosporangiaceae bacterium]|nr:class I SAM-dependent methyltransferase [Streptosporangiaceae bacterium]